MKVNFALPRDGAVHRICLRCHADGVLRLNQEGRIMYVCPACSHADGKSLYWGAGVEWVADDGELWHDTAAVVVRSRAGKVLLYERTEFPFGFWTIPAGHIDLGEAPKAAAARELAEETAIQAHALRHAITLDIPGAACSGGADAHRWHVYVETVDDSLPVHISQEEGRYPVWLAPEEALAYPLLPAVQRLLQVMDVSADRTPIAQLAKACFFQYNVSSRSDSRMGD